MNRLGSSLISICAIGCGAAHPSKPPPPVAPIAVTPPPTFAESPVTALADEMCGLALDVVHERPLRFHRLTFGEIERHVPHSMAKPEPPCLAVGFDLSVALKSPTNDAGDLQPVFLLTRRRLTAVVSRHTSTPSTSLASNANVFPEIEPLFASFVDAVATGHADAFQPSEVVCADLGIAASEECRHEMSEPMMTKEIADALTAPSAKDRTVMLSRVYVYARAADMLVQMRLDFDGPPDLVFRAKPAID